MVFVIIILLTSIFILISMLVYQAWKIENNKMDKMELNNIPHIPFRHIEKSMLYLTKHTIQWIILSTVKYWFIIITKSRKKIKDKWPNIYTILKKRKRENNPSRLSYVQRAIIESKIKIRRVKEKVIRDHEKKI